MPNVEMSDEEYAIYLGTIAPGAEPPLNEPADNPPDDEPANEPPFPQGGEKLHPNSYGED